MHAKYLKHIEKTLTKLLQKPTGSKILENDAFWVLKKNWSW